MSLPEVVSRDEWLVARKGLLAEEKELTRRRDALNAERRRLPMVEVIKEYVFHGPEGEARLLDLFAGRRQLVVGHSAGADEVSQGLLDHLHARETTLAYVSRAPWRRSSATRRRRAGPSPGTRRTAGRRRG